MKTPVAFVAFIALLLTASLIQSRLTRAASPPAEPAFTTLSNDSLQTMLDQMGYSPKKLSKGYLIAIKRDTWTLNMQLVLSPDGSKLGINANLGQVENPAAVTADQWKALLMANGDIDPSFFYFDATQKKLYLHRSLDNRAIDPAFLRKQIDAFCDNMTATSDTWKFTK